MSLKLHIHYGDQELSADVVEKYPKNKAPEDVRPENVDLDIENLEDTHSGESVQVTERIQKAFKNEYIHYIKIFHPED